MWEKEERGERIMNNGYISESLAISSSIDAAVIVALISGAIAIISVMVNSIVSYRTKRMEHDHSEAREARLERREIQEKMIDPYSKLVSLISELFSLITQEKAMNDKELLKRIKEFNIAVILYGSNEVISKWGDYRINAASPNHKEILLKLEEVLYEIREDLGFHKKDMGRGNILNLFINDVENLGE